MNIKAEMDQHKSENAKPVALFEIFSRVKNSADNKKKVQTKDPKVQQYMENNDSNQPKDKEPASSKVRTPIDHNPEPTTPDKAIERKLTDSLQDPTSTTTDISKPKPKRKYVRRKPLKSEIQAISPSLPEPKSSTQPTLELRKETPPTNQSRTKPNPKTRPFETKKSTANLSSKDSTESEKLTVSDQDLPKESIVSQASINTSPREELKNATNRALTDDSTHDPSTPKPKPKRQYNRRTPTKGPVKARSDSEKRSGSAVKHTELDVENELVLNYFVYRAHLDARTSGYCFGEEKRRKYTEEDVENVFDMVYRKNYNIKKASRYAGVLYHTARVWVKTDEKRRLEAACSQIILDRKPQIHESRNFFKDKHRNYVKGLYRERPDLKVSVALKLFEREFPDMKISYSSLYHFIKTDCNIISYMSSNFRERNSEKNMSERFKWAKEHTLSQVNFTRNCIFIGEGDFLVKRKDENPDKGVEKSFEYHKYLSALSDKGLVNLEKAKMIEGNGDSQTVANTKYFEDFIKRTITILSRIKGHNIKHFVLPHYTRDNESIKLLLENNGYTPYFLPDSAYDINPVEQYWTLLKDKMRIHKFKHFNTTLNEKIVKVTNRLKLEDWLKMYEKSEDIIILSSLKVPLC